MHHSPEPNGTGEWRPGQPSAGIIFALGGMVQWLAFPVESNFVILAMSPTKMTNVAAKEIMARKFSRISLLESLSNQRNM